MIYSITHITYINILHTYILHVLSKVAISNPNPNDGVNSVDLVAFAEPFDDDVLS